MNCPNCGEAENLKEGVVTNGLDHFDYGCQSCKAVFNESDSQ